MYSVWSASVNLNLFQISIEWFSTLKPISGGMGWDGMDGRLSPFDGLLRAPTVLIIYSVTWVANIFLGCSYMIKIFIYIDDQ